jgi:23S rRNA (guanosine2251-2'-O)-methyltransferase
MTSSKKNKHTADRKRFSGNHQRSWLWGHHAVLETLRAGLWPIAEVLVTAEVFAEASDLLHAKKNAGVSVSVVSAARLFELVKTQEHQGSVARLGPYPYQTLGQFESQLRQVIETQSAQPTSGGCRTRPALVVICDQIQDAFNFGAILRSCDGAGVLAVVVGKQHQAEVTPHVVRSSVGAVNYVPVVQVDDLVAAARRIQSLGFQLIGSEGNALQRAWSTPLNCMAALVVGSEAAGITPELLAICDQRLCIPMQGGVTSLNVAVATGILLYEIRRQQHWFEHPD